jgi:hypothetical protein
MKQIILVLYVLLCLLETTHAAIYIADNRPEADISPTHIHGNIGDAINAAVSGDTIFVVGSAVSYGNITLYDSLFIFGAGHNPNSALTLQSLLGTVTFSTFSAGSVLSGFKTGVITVNTDNIEISNCWIQTLNFNGGKYYLIEGNYFNRSYLGAGAYYSITGSSSVAESVLRNNIFQSTIRYFTAPTVLFDQNLFLRDASGGFQFSSSVKVENNIFLGVDDSTGCDNCVYTETIVGVDTTNGNLDFYYIGGTGVGLDPLIEGMIINPDNSFPNGLYNYQSLTLLPGSPAIGAGTFGQDLGVLGGLVPYTETGHPPLPQIVSWNGPGQVVQAGGTLNVTIQAKAAD